MVGREIYTGVTLARNNPIKQNTDEQTPKIFLKKSSSAQGMENQRLYFYPKVRKGRFSMIRGEKSYQYL